MSKNRIGKKTKERFKRGIQNVVKGLGDEVLVYKSAIESQCPNCFFDKSTDSSTNKCKWTALEAYNKQEEYEIETGKSDLKYKFFKLGRCPVCKGDGMLSTSRKIWINCLITWNPPNNIYTSAGSETVTVVELKTDPKYQELFNSCKEVFVHGVKCVLSKPPFQRGLGNNSILVVTLFSSDKIGATDETALKNYF